MIRFERNQYKRQGASTLKFSYYLDSIAKREIKMGCPRVNNFVGARLETGGFIMGW